MGKELSLLDRINAWLLAVLLIIAPAEANASQGSLFSPTTGTVSGLQLTNNYNNAVDAINTGNSGATAPTNQLSGVPSLGNIWINTTSNPNPHQVYDGTNWLTPYWIDATNHYTDVKIGGGTATVASAATVDLCGSSVAPMAIINITGNTTITSFGSSCNVGHIKVIQFAGALTLTYNGTSLIIPGAANVITAAGDQAVVYSLGGGNWQVLAYTLASGQALINPSVDIGTYEMTRLTAPPSSKWLFAYGQAVSRTTYASYMASTTITQSVTRTNGSPTLTGFSDTTQIPTGAAIEGAGIPTSTTISSCTSTTCTMSANASSSGTANVTVFPDGDGDGSTTFNLPNCQGVVLAGRDNMSGTARGFLTSSYYGTNPDALSAIGGGQNVTMALANLIAHQHAVYLHDPGHSHSDGTSNLNFTGNASGFPNTGANIAFGSNGSTNSNTTGITIGSVNGVANDNLTAVAGFNSPTPMRTIQPTMTANCMIRVLAMLHAMPMQHFVANDNVIAPLAIVDRRRTTG